MTMNYLLAEIADRGEEGRWAEWYDFLWNRTRGIRKDITQQQLCSREVVELIEKCVRFHIYCSERLCMEDMMVFDSKINNENLTKCLQTLKEMYADLENKQNILCPYEAEFRAYMVLMNLNEGDTLREVQQLRPDVRSSPEIDFAVKAYSALNSNNYVRFFRLLERASFLNACVLHRYFNQMRARALQILLRAYTKGPRQKSLFPLSELVRLLAFENEDHVREFCAYYGLLSEGSDLVLDRSMYVEPESAIPAWRAQGLVESKQTVSVGQAVKMIARDLFWEVIDETARDVSQSLYNAIQFYLSFDKIFTDEVLAEVSSQMIKETSLEVLDSERSLQLQQKEEERQERQHRLTEEASTAIVFSTVEEEGAKIAQVVLREARAKDHAERQERCANAICSELLMEINADMTQSIAEEVHAVDVVARLQLLSELQKAVELKRASQLFAMWRKAYAVRQRQKRAMLDFPCAPSMQHPANILRTTVTRLGVEQFQDNGLVSEVAVVELPIKPHDPADVAVTSQVLQIQAANTLIGLYNSVLDHMALALTSPALQDISWPAPELLHTPTAVEGVPPPDWNSKSHLADIYQLVSSLRLPWLRYQDQEASEWSQVCQDVWAFVNGLSKSCGTSSVSLTTRVSYLLARTCSEFENLCSLTQNEDYCTPTYVNAPWVDIILACVNFHLERLHNWKDEGECVVSGDLEVFYEEEDMEEFEPPAAWIQALLDTEDQGLVERLNNGENIIVAEGYLFEFERRGYLRAGAFVPEVVLERPDLVKILHEEFVHAGSDVVLAFQYYGHREKLRVIGREADLETLNRTALRIAREVADATGTLMAGNICNTTVYQRDNPQAIQEAEQIFKEQIEWAVEAGADYIVAETYSELGEAMLALESIKKYGKGLPAAVSFIPHEKDKTFDGVPYGEACRRLEEAGAAVVGLNCGRGPRLMMENMKEVRKACKSSWLQGPIMALPSPYRTTEQNPIFQRLVNPETGKVAFPNDLPAFLCSRTEIEEFARDAKALGVQYVGLCCGNASHYLRVLAEGYGRKPPASRFSPNMKEHFIFGENKHQKDYYSKQLKSTMVN
nr:hypothetical protein BaRGS_026145 [Batillaria attramentaria]